MKLSWKALIIIGLVVAAIILYGLWSSGEYRKLKAEYNAYRQTVATDKAKSDKIIEQKNQDISLRDEKIKTLTKQDTVNMAKIGSLSGELAVLKSHEPVQTALEKEPLVINLRAQIGKQNEIVQALTTSLALKDQIIEQWAIKFNDQVVISDQWHSQYDNEHKLRLLCEGLVKKSEMRGLINIFGLHINPVRDILVPAVALGAGYLLGKK
jgi:FtsZ-interacting cell division protein ZipA